MYVGKKKCDENVKALGKERKKIKVLLFSPSPSPFFFGRRIRLLYERFGENLFFVGSGCQHMRCKSLGWNALAVLPQHSTHCDVCTGLLLYSLSEDTLDAHALQTDSPQ